MYIRLVQDFGLECEVAQHLSKSYGDRAFAVAKMASLTGKRWPIIGKKIHPEFPYIDAEVKGIRFRNLNIGLYIFSHIFLYIYITTYIIILYFNLFLRYVTVYGSTLEPQSI